MKINSYSFSQCLLLLLTTNELLPELWEQNEVSRYLETQILKKKLPHAMLQAFKPLSVCFDGPFEIYNETFMTGIRMKQGFKQLTKI